MPSFKASLVLVAACGSGGGGGSSPKDGAVDTSGGAPLQFTGEYIDWDSDTTFCGIFAAQLKVTDTGAQESLPPNGRINISIPDQPITLIDIEPPATVPDCKVDKSNNYVLPAIAVANREVIQAGAFWSGRNFVNGRETVDPTKAQVYVHIVGPQRAVSLDAAHAHGAPQAVTMTSWNPGNLGHEVFIPDVDPVGGACTVIVDGGAIGDGSIPLAIGKITTLTVVTH